MKGYDFDDIVLSITRQAVKQCKSGIEQAILNELVQDIREYEGKLNDILNRRRDRSRITRIRRPRFMTARRTMTEAKLVTAVYLPAIKRGD